MQHSTAPRHSFERQGGSRVPAGSSTRRTLQFSDPRIISHPVTKSCGASESLEAAAHFSAIREGQRYPSGDTYVGSDRCHGIVMARRSARLRVTVAPPHGHSYSAPVLARTRTLHQDSNTRAYHQESACSAPQGHRLSHRRLRRIRETLLHTAPQRAHDPHVTYHYGQGFFLGCGGTA